MDQTNIYEQILKWMNLPLIHVGASPVTLSGILTAVIVFVVFLFLSGVLQKVLIRRVANQFKMESGMIYALTRVVHYVMLVCGAILATQCIGINLGSFAVVFGFLSVGIGFGLQNVTSNFIAGLILLLERPINVGDMVSVEGHVGKVLQINIRTTVIETADRVSIIVPNSKFIEGHVINWSHGDPKVRVHCPVGVAYGSDIQKVTAILLRVAAEASDAIQDPAPEVAFLNFGESSLDLELLVWTGSPDKQKCLRSEVNYAIYEAFAKEGIEIPFPQRDLHLKTTPSAIELFQGIGKKQKETV
ncbi:MAG TPA: mechanosensitive ion channel protein MscS [Candidatus Omnitrophica bacterium]|nr:mechanosensitive ion channel protein MscS [Candidatus Omnitrophota bacterium]